MNVYSDGSVVHVEVQFVQGTALFTPASASYRVLNESFEELVPETALAIGVGETVAAITVDASVNTLGGVLRGLRLVEVTAHTDDGNIVTLAHRYIIAATHVLFVGRNSYQTFEQAILTAMDMPPLNGWRVSTEAQQVGAMIEAHHRLGLLDYAVTFDDSQSRLGGSIYVDDINGLTEAEFMNLPERFVVAIRRAQLAEADVILGGDPVGERRRDGLMVETIGESKNMFRHGKPLEFPVSNRALRYLTGYVKLGAGLARR